MSRKSIELLSPAKTRGHAFAAIDAGADAVYIGGPAFSARAVASNTFDDIAEVVRYAHLFGAKVYVALNTILTDAEVSQAVAIVQRLYEIGVDALITQDFALVSLKREGKLPPIPIHASTQMNNRTVEKVKFLEACGFEQVVVARESSLDQIREIANATGVRLETFIHGALCVSLSGQCYLSERLMNRSANRGECGQPCRLPYSLVDAEGKQICRDKHLLSLKDFRAEEYLEELILAGVSSFKIEGRLKDVSYVKNVTAYYRKRIDEILARHPQYVRSSRGESRPSFVPCLEKSFNRGFTTYNLSGKRVDIASIDSPKSKGEYIGKCAGQQGNKVLVDSRTPLANGDGFTFTDRNGEPKGFRADRAETGAIYVASGVNIPKGVELYRNYDKVFEDALAKDNMLRLLPIDIELSDAETGIKFTAREGDREISFVLEMEKQKPQNPEMARQNIERTLSKTGGTNFFVNEVKMSSVWFIPNSVLANVKRRIIDELMAIPKTIKADVETSSFDALIPYALPTNYLANVHNKMAHDFVSAINGGCEVSYSFERTHENEIELMRCHHCIRHTLGMCKKERSTSQYREPFYLVTPQGQRLRLKFECDKCEMVIIG